MRASAKKEGKKMIREYTLRVLVVDEVDCYFVRPGGLVRMAADVARAYLRLVADKPEFYLPPAPARSVELAAKTGEYHVEIKPNLSKLLRGLAEFNEPLTAAEICQMFEMHKSTGSSKLSLLKKYGLLNHDEENHRFLVSPNGHAYLVEHQKHA